MELNNKKIGFAMTGSYCTFDIALNSLKELKDAGADIYPILSFNAANTDTRFMKCSQLKEKLKELTGKEPICTIVDAEPIGPKKLLDLLIVAPATGNSIAKIALGLTDTPVTMAVKAHLRNSKPVLIAISTNDALSANAKNLGILMNTKNIYFVPFTQDDCYKKCTSLISDMSKIVEAAQYALDGEQLQPLIY